MKISCQSCGAKYNIADEKVRGKVVKIACKKCGARIEIDGRAQADQVQDQDETRVYEAAQLPTGSLTTDTTWTVSVDDNTQLELTTQALLEKYGRGEINGESFAWREGMSDWQPLKDIDALRDSLSGASTSTSDAPKGGQAAAPGGEPARLGGTRRGGGQDLFATQAGSETAEDEEVSTSAHAVLAGAGSHGPPAAIRDDKPIGARNENSVLFSLNSLTSGADPAPARSAAPMGGASGDSEKSGLIDIQKLAASSGSAQKDNRAQFDDLMNLGAGGAFASPLGAPILAPPSPEALGPTVAESHAAEQKKGKGMMFALLGAAVVIAGLVVVLVMVMGKPDATASKDKDKDKEKSSETDKAKVTTGDKKADVVAGKDPVPPASSESATPPEPGGPIGSASAKGTAKPAGVPTGPAAPATAPPPGPGKDPKVPPTTPTAKPPASPACPPGMSALDCAMGAKKEPTPPAAPAGGAEFDKAAATAALGRVSYSDCGSGGAGKVQVTFAPSGSVSSATVTAGEYDASTKNCIAGRFKGAKVPAFGGDPKSFGWKVNL